MIKDIAVKEIMSREVITVRQNDRLTKAQQILSTNPIHHLVVIKDGKVSGILSKADMMGAMLNGNGKIVHESEISIAEVMTKNPMTVEPDDTIGLVADIILANKFHSLPVVEDGELVGIVTSHDLLKHVYK
ncbi:MAG: CBS domain-containing protein [Saprospiraceae bacterium]|nr:CBS domain-containing protein [Saprospiraceae bacterium]